MRICAPVAYLCLIEENAMKAVKAAMDMQHFINEFGSGK